MIWKKLCSILIVTAFLAGGCLPVFAKTELTDRTIFELQSLGIVQGDGEGNLHLDDPLTRAEFAAIIVPLCGLEGVSPAGFGQKFSDVNPEDWFFDDISRVCAGGFMNGDGDGKFRPQDTVSTPEAMKVLVDIMEYKSYAEENGGYPDGYRKAAMGIGMMRGIDASGNTLTRADVLGMIDNCLDVYLGTPSYNQTGSWSLSEDTLRDRLLDGNSKEKLYEIRGIMTANATMHLSGDATKELKDNQVVIDGVTYFTEAPAADYIGRSVECFVREDREGTQTIVSIRASKDNQTVTVKDRDFSGVHNAEATFWNEDEKEETLQLDAGAIYVRNMRVVQEYQDRDIAMTRGSVTFIDNDGDGAYDIVDVEAFESYLVTDVREQSIYFQIRSDEQALKFLNFADDEDKMYQIMDADGKIIEPEDIQPDTVVSVFESLDGDFCRVITGTGMVEGTISTKEDETITLDGKQYTLEPGYSDKARPGDSAVFYLNFRGEAALQEENAESTSTLVYGYVAELAANDSLGDSLIGKIVQPGKFVEVEEKSDIEDDTSVTLKLKGQNSGIKQMEFTSQVTVDGKRMDAGQLMNYFNQGGQRTNRVISYRTNAEGKIRQILSPEVVGNELNSREQKRVYNAKEKLFGGKMVGAFGAQETTKVLMIPDYEKQGAVSDEDYLASVEINDDQEYTINGYDIQRDNECVRVITIMTTLQYDSSSAILDRDKLSVLTKSAMTLDEEENQVTSLTFWSDGVKKSYLVEDEVEGMAKALKFGDLFYYALSPSSNRISKIVRVDNALHPSRGQGQFGDSMDSNPEGYGQITAGVIKDIAYNKVEDIANRRVDRFSIGFETGGTAEVLVNSRNSPPVYRINLQKNTIEVIETRDITPMDGTVMIQVKNNTVRGIVIVR